MSPADVPVAPRTWPTPSDHEASDERPLLPVPAAAQPESPDSAGLGEPGIPKATKNRAAAPRALTSIENNPFRPELPPRPIAAPSPFPPLDRRHVLILAERLSGFYAWKSSLAFRTAAQTATTDLHGTMLNLLFGNTGTNSPDGFVNPYAAPRLGADAILPLGITVGASLGYLSVGGAREDRSPDGSRQSTSFPDGHAFLIAPRAGWIHAFGPWLAVWPRAGVTYVSLADSHGREHSSLHYTTLTVDPALVVTPFSHVGVLVGPTLDFALGGGGEVVDGTGMHQLDASFANYGGAASLAMYF